jgi:hypothetical protein
MQASKDLLFAMSRKASPPPIVTPSTMAPAITIRVAGTGMSSISCGLPPVFPTTNEVGSLVRAPRQDDYRRIGPFGGGHGAGTLPAADGAALVFPRKADPPGTEH